MGLAFALVAACVEPTSRTWFDLFGHTAQGVALGALSGVGMLLAQAALQRGPSALSSAMRANRLAAALVMLWTILAAVRGLQGQALVPASEPSGVLTAVATSLFLVLSWHGFVSAFERGSATHPTARTFLVAALGALIVGPARRWMPSDRMALLPGLLTLAVALTGTIALRLAARAQRWLPRTGDRWRRLQPAAWGALGAATIAGLVLKPSAGRGGGDDLPAVFRSSTALRDHTLVKLGPEVRAVVAARGNPDMVYPIHGAGRVELAWGTGVPSEKGVVRFRAIVRKADRSKQVVVDEELTPPAPNQPTWFSRVIDLPPDAKDGTLLLRARGASRAAFWTTPCFSQYAGPAPSAANVILVSMDTVRADHLGAYGYTRRPTSPEFDDWARKGTLFETAMSASPGTLSSQMSILTGRYPSSHRVSYANYRRSGNIPVLAPDVHTLAEALRSAGFRTAAFTGAGYFAMPTGYSRGFGEFVSTDDATLGSAESVFEKGFAWLERHRDRPFFVFLHTYEAHEPYLDQRFVYQEGLGFQDPKARNEALYDGDIRRLDTYLGKLRGTLDRLDLASRTLVVLVADHGEEFADHFPVWSDGHGHALFEEQVHVPFVMVGPSIPQGRRLAPAVDLTSVAPTILEFLGVKAPDGMEGRELMPMIRGERTAEDGFAFSEDVWIGPTVRSARIRDWKLIEKGETLPERFLDREARRTIVRDVGAQEPRLLFHLPSDPGERKNRLATDAQVADRLGGFLKDRLATFPPAGTDSEIEVDQEMLERLRALGYVR